MASDLYRAQVELLLNVLPYVAEEKCFALKGGTAINLFIWNMPRLSVDIDLCYLPIKSRQESLEEIAEAIKRLKKRIESELSGSKVLARTVGEINTATSFTVELNRVQIKCEVNFVLRGTVFPTSVATLCADAKAEFKADAEIETLSIADLYGGKFCAALDRQHPRDLFDVKLLLENRGITPQITTAFVVYLASHSRPMNELLNPTWKDLTEIFNKEFQGMPRRPISLDELANARGLMFEQLKSGLTASQKQFLVSIKEGTPEWEALGVEGIEKLPALRWKVLNVKKMAKDKREGELRKLKSALDL